MTEITQADTHIIGMTVAAFKTAQEQARMEERAAILTFLRSGQFEDLDGHDIAEEIEAGAHTNYHPPSTRRQP